MPPDVDGLVLPDTDGPAINDQYSRTVYRAIAAMLGLELLGLLALALAAAALFVFAAHAVLGLAAALVVVVTFLRLGHAAARAIRVLPSHRRLLRNYSWRPARLVGVARTAITVDLDGETLHLHSILPKVSRATINHEQIWVLGPDAKGWVRVRAPGQVASRLLRRIAAAKTVPFAEITPPPTGPPTRATFRRYANAWLSRQLLWPATLLLFGVPVAIGGLRAVRPFIPLVIGGTSIGLSIPLLAATLYQLPALSLIRIRLINRPTAARLRLVSVTPRRLPVYARAEAEFDVPDGRTLTLRMGRAPLDLVANIRAGASVELYGELVPGRSIAVVVAGHEFSRARAHVLGR